MFSRKASSMGAVFAISIEKAAGRDEVCDLVLTATHGATWRKRYYGNLFLLFDAQQLGLLDQDMRRTGQGTQRAALAKKAVVDEDALIRLHFSKEDIQNG